MYRDAIESFKNKTVLVIGDVMLDKYTHGEVSRLSPEAPIQIVSVHEEKFIPGGAANVAANVVSLGAKAYICGVIGEDEAGDHLRMVLEGLQIDTEGLLAEPNYSTIQKNRIIAQNQQLLRLDYEKSQCKYDEEEFIHNVEGLATHADIIILSDYRKGVVTKRLNKCLEKIQSKGKRVLIDPKPENAGIYLEGALFTPNRKEAYSIMQASPNEPVERVGYALMKKLNADVLMTLSEDGMLWTPRDGKQTRIPTRAHQVYDVTGAGDTVIATLALGMTTNIDEHDAINLANHAAGVAVETFGCASVSPRQLLTAFDVEDSKIKDREAILYEVGQLRSRGKTIATLNGCFDILHPGHIHIITQAKAQADILIILLNDDASITRNKGPERPINNQLTRSTVIAALGVVDFVCIFTEDTPSEMILDIKPDVHVNDASYGEDCIESPAVKKAGARLHLVDKYICPSTTDTISKIKDTLQ